MKKIYFLLFVLSFGVADAATLDIGKTDFSCGTGYVLNQRRDVDGVDALECQKLWCYDLETGKIMGNGETAASGYRVTTYPGELTVGGDTISCWGERKWCSGQPVGEWDGEYGMYIRDGGDNAYESYLKGGCFTWRLREHNCPAGTTAILNDSGEWECATVEVSEQNVRGSAIRRSGGGRRILKKN